MNIETGSITRLLIGISVAVICGAILMIVCQFLLIKLNPPSTEIKPEQIEAFKLYVQSWPQWMFALLIGSYMAGSVIAGALVSWISRLHPYPALMCAMVLMVAGFINLYRMPHPLWFSIATGVVFIVAAWLGSAFSQYYRLQSHTT